MVPKELFARYVKDALSSYYDPVHLQTHPLAELLVSTPTPAETRGQVLRQQLRDAIASLRPDSSVPFGRPEWLGYRILWLRYIESAEQSQVCDELCLSRTSYYRHHLEAFQAAVSILWDLYIGDSEPASPQEEASPDGAEPYNGAVKLATSGQKHRVEVAEVVQNVERMIRPLAQQQGIVFRSSVPQAITDLLADPAVLRQIMLNILTEAIKLAGDDGLELVARQAPDQTLWRLNGLVPIAGGLERIAGFAISESLLKAYGGKLWFEKTPSQTDICFAIPVIAPGMAHDTGTILIIDDDVETIDLYRRYMQNRSYQVLVAANHSEAIDHLEKTVPDLILLDVLMPNEDGWDVLQRLRTSTNTRDIPVVICSVLSQPRLALALGATTVLQKPISRDLLLRTVSEELARERR